MKKQSRTAFSLVEEAEAEGNQFRVQNTSICFSHKYFQVCSEFDTLPEQAKNMVSTYSTDVIALFSSGCEGEYQCAVKASCFG